MANFKENTRHTNGIITKTREGKDFLVLRKLLKLTSNAGDVFIVVTKELEQRPDLISQKAYGVPDLWWAIYEFNGIVDPFFDVQAGMKLRIPALNRVIEAIKKLGIN